jgi:uncharacterized Zn-binding protein involved in type VI secretion
MGKPAARIGDMHTCPMVTPGTPPVPHVGGPISGPSVPNVLIGGKPASVMGDMCVCTGPPDSIVLGSMGVMIGGKPAARMGDMTAHGGVITLGQPNVLIGEMMPGPPPVVVNVVGAMVPSAAVAKTASSMRDNAKNLDKPQQAMAKQMATMLDASANGTPFCDKCAEKSESDKFKSMSKEERKAARRDAIAKLKDKADENRKMKLQQAQKETMKSASKKGTGYVPKCEKL